MRLDVDSGLGLCSVDDWHNFTFEAAIEFRICVDLSSTRTSPSPSTCGGRRKEKGEIQATLFIGLGPLGVSCYSCY